MLNGHNISCGECIRGKHGLSNTRLYDIWSAIKKRCNNPNAINYKDYGGRGIKICNEWLNNFVEFYNWSINNGYSENLSIDRINVDGDYCPENCRWISLEEQQRNKRNNILYEINNEKKTLLEWAREYNIKETTINNRIYALGWTIEEALEIKSRSKRVKGKTYTINGVSKGIYGWAEQFNIDPEKVSSRINMGWTIEEALEIEKRVTIRKKTGKKYTINNESLTLSEWAEKYNLTKGTVRGRIKEGYSIEEALELVNIQFRDCSEYTIELEGNIYNLSQACKKLNLDYSKVKNRLNNMNWSIEEALELTPRQQHKGRIFEIDGEKMNISDLSKKYNIKASKISDRLRAGWTLNEAIEIIPRPRKRNNTKKD